MKICPDKTDPLYGSHPSLWDMLSLFVVQVMAITAHENLNLIAVGFKDGTVLLLRGNITRDRQSRQSIIHRELVSNCYVTGQGHGNRVNEPADTRNACFTIIYHPFPIQFVWYCSS